MIQGLIYILLHRVMAIVFYYHHLRHSLLTLSHNYCTLKCSYLSQNRTWFPLGNLIDSLSSFISNSGTDIFIFVLLCWYIHRLLFFFSAFRNNSKFTLFFSFSLFTSSSGDFRKFYTLIPICMLQYSERKTLVSSIQYLYSS